MSKSDKRTCANCSEEFIAHPPDDIHTVALAEPCKEGDSIQRIYQCQNCDYRNIIHWDSVHTLMAKV